MTLLFSVPVLVMLGLMAVLVTVQLPATQAVIPACILGTTPAAAPSSLSRRQRHYGVLTENESSDNQAECGNKLPSISGGDDALMGDFPWAVHINVDYKDGYGYGMRRNHLCSGVLLSKRHVLTNAHCVVDPVYKRIPTEIDIRVFYGHINISQFCVASARTFTVNPAYIHNLMRPQMGSELAIIQLDRNVTHKNATHHSHHICLPNLRTTFKEQLDIYSWGEPPRTLQKANARYLPRSHNCDTWLREPRAADLNCMRLGEGVGVCRGDTGAGFSQEADGSTPAGSHRYRHYLMGIVGWMYASCGEPHTVNIPIAFYTDVRLHLGWICSYTGICATPEMRQHWRLN